MFVGGSALSLRLSPLAGRGRSASAIRVRGSLREGGGNRFENASQSARDVVVPKSQDLVVVVGEPFISDGVASVVRVLPAVYFHNQTAFPADEVNGVRSDRFLSDELISTEPSRTKAIPEHPFHIRRGAAQSSRAVGLGLIGTAHAEAPPHPSRFARRPLPASGERRRRISHEAL